jgi:hypothetical protein
MILPSILNSHTVNREIFAALKVGVEIFACFKFAFDSAYLVSLSLPDGFI